jgi:ubiquinone/menaquinone biosynthesis C-methylase UbiE
MPDLSKLYQFRFREGDWRNEKRIWKVLCERFFQPLIGDDLVVLDLACGHGAFINNIRAKKKYAVDLNPDARTNLADDIEFFLAAADKMPAIGDGAVDVVFASNFLEHLRSKEECDRVFAEVRRILRPGGRFVILGPNIRYLASRYWDFYDHCLPLSHLSLEEGLAQADYEIERIIPRFLPYTTRSRLPQHPFLVALYLRVPPAWRLLGRQFLVVARKRSDAVKTPA